ncbi:MAG: IPExxxVDY family protein [Bacteroidales bacterium]|nr:IPExxxVDY family protein [Bacteroidales bacterium]
MINKPKIIKLNIEPDLDFRLIAIATSMNDYNLSWKINKSLDISLQRDEELLVELENSKEKKAFSLYRCCENSNGLRYVLVANKSENGLLLRDLPNIDFFLKISGEIYDNEENEIVSAIKNTEGIMIAYVLTKELLPNTQHKKFFTVFSTF